MTRTGRREARTSFRVNAADAMFHSAVFKGAAAAEGATAAASTDSSSAGGDGSANVSGTHGSEGGSIGAMATASLGAAGGGGSGGAGSAPRMPPRATDVFRTRGDASARGTLQRDSTMLRVNEHGMPVLAAVPTRGAGADVGPTVSLVAAAQAHIAKSGDAEGDAARQRKEWKSAVLASLVVAQPVLVTAVGAGGGVAGSGAGSGADSSRRGGDSSRREGGGEVGRAAAHQSAFTVHTVRPARQHRATASVFNMEGAPRAGAAGGSSGPPGSAPLDRAAITSNLRGFSAALGARGSGAATGATGGGVISAATGGATGSLADLAAAVAAAAAEDAAAGGDPASTSPSGLPVPSPLATDATPAAPGDTPAAPAAGSPALTTPSPSGGMDVVIHWNYNVRAPKLVRAREHVLTPVQAHSLLRGAAAAPVLAAVVAAPGAPSLALHLAGTGCVAAALAATSDAGVALPKGATYLITDHDLAVAASYLWFSTWAPPEGDAP